MLHTFQEEFRGARLSRETFDISNSQNPIRSSKSAVCAGGSADGWAALQRQRLWLAPGGHPGPPPVRIHYSTHVVEQVDRSTVGLYYSGNGFDWHPAGILDYHLSFGRHFTYPHMAIAGEDLLVVMRATFESGKLEATANYYVS